MSRPSIAATAFLAGIALSGCASAASTADTGIARPGGPFGAEARATSYGVVEAFPVFLEPQDEADRASGLGADLGIDPRSTRRIAEHDGRTVWLGADQQRSTVCALLRTAGEQREPWVSCAAGVDAVDPTRQLFSFALDGSAVYSVWPRAGDAHAEAAGWTRVAENLWSR